MDSVGSLLRRAREEQGFTLDELAQRTRIHARMLEAIEADAPDRLPGGFFYKSFVRQYADELHVSDVAIDRALEAVPQPATAFPLRPDDRLIGRGPVLPIERTLDSGWHFPARATLTSVALLVVVLLGCSGLYTWWHGERVQAETRAEQAKLAASTNPPTANQPVAAVEPAATKTARTEETATSDSNTNSSESTNNAAPAAPAESNAEPAARGPISLEIAASEPTWLSISADGKHLFSGVLQARDTKAIDGTTSAKLVIGNAGGLQIRLNGKEIGPIGPRGQVRKIVFSDGKFRIGPVGDDDES